jgi:hypothetical protein
MFEDPEPEQGTKMTFPFGVNTPPRNFAVPEAPTVKEFETVDGAPGEY